MIAHATEAFMVTAGIARPVLSRVTQPQAMAPDLALTTINAMPTSMMIADEAAGGGADILLLGSAAGLFSAIFLFAVVGTVVINFGIMKK